MTRNSIRFPALQGAGPGIGTYDIDSFTDILQKQRASTKGTLSNMSKDEYANLQMRKNSSFYSPGPCVYNKNYAIGRNVASDYSFRLSKSDSLLKREQDNAAQLRNLKELIGKDDIFTDKLACRRMAYFALHF